MSQHLQRALLLYQQRRFDLAEQELRQALVTDPDNAFPHAILAMCLSDLERYDEATEEARQAVHLGPDFGMAHYALAYVYFDRDRPKEAAEAIAEAIRLEPDDADNFGLLAAIQFNLRDWSAALRAAEMGLQYDPEHGQCTNLRAMSLVKLGRRSEAGATIGAALERNPESAISHANMGWTLLHNGEPKQAMEHFREALRLDPEMDWARQGIVEAMKARNVIYRWLLGYFLWMARLSHKAQWGVIIGLYVAYRVLSNLANEHPAAAPYIYPLLIVYGLFALLTWIGAPLFNLLLRFNRFGRLVLSRDEVRAANWLAICLGGGVAGGLIYWATDEFAVLVAAIGSAALAIPVSTALRRPPGWPRKVLTIYTATLAVTAAVAALTAYWGDRPEHPDWCLPLFKSCATLFFFGWIAFSWVANGLAMARVQR